NLIELKGKDGNVIVLSTRAAASLKDSQREALGRHGTVVTANIDTIETCGGGSVRCMLAEVFLPRKPRTE
ncbi:MAG TPA: arginine deiminase-related protein, partial [Gammaproteobacteria bacterium]